MRVALLIVLMALANVGRASARLPGEGRAEARPTSVVILPLSNAPIENALAQKLVKRGWNVVQGEEVETFLEEKRVRYLDSLPAEVRAQLLEKMNASAIVFGSVLVYRENGNPVVAFAARMIDAEGAVLWGEVAAVSSIETEGALGFGKHATIEPLANEVAAQLVARIPRPGEVRRPDLFRGSARTYRSSAHPRGEVRRVCILPFTTTSSEAARVISEVLTVRLEATGEFDVVEPAEFRAAMRAEKLRSVGAMTSTELALLGKHLGTNIFLRGNIHTWREAAGGRSEIQFDMTLTDVASGEVLWAVTHQRRGSDYAGILQRGTVQNIVALADRALSEAISAQHRARPKTRKGL